MSINKKRLEKAGFLQNYPIASREYFNDSGFKAIDHYENGFLICMPHKDTGIMVKTMKALKKFVKDYKYDGSYKFPVQIYNACVGEEKRLTVPLCGEQFTVIYVYNGDPMKPIELIGGGEYIHTELPAYLVMQKIDKKNPDKYKCYVGTLEEIRNSQIFRYNEDNPLKVL